MSTAASLRWIGGLVLLFILYVMGRTDMQAPWPFVLTFGFAFGYEYLVVRPLSNPSAPPAPAATSVAASAPQSGLDWWAVGGKISTALEHLVHTDAACLAGPFARVVLSKTGDVHLYFDQREPAFLLGHGDIACMFLRQNPASFAIWAEELQASGGTQEMVKTATDQFAIRLVSGLRGIVE